MQIKNLSLKNFRNYADESFTFSRGAQRAVRQERAGQNQLRRGRVLPLHGCVSACPQGQAAYYARRKQGRNFCPPRAARYGDVNISASIYENGREVRVNGNKIARNADLLGNVFSVFFSPSELRLIQDGPDERRRFLNISISQLSRPYYTALLRYNKILEQRNNLLKDRDIGLSTTLCPSGTNSLQSMPQ